MSSGTTFEIFLVCAPGLEKPLSEEAAAAGFAGVRQIAGGVTLIGAWHDVWRANLELRGATRVLARITAFHANHLAQLDKRARTVPWTDYLRRNVPVRIEAACKRSKIYHSGAAAQRIATAITQELGAPVTDDADVTVMARIENNLVTISIDTSGDLLHKRGAKQAMAKAPMRETTAAMFLRQCGYRGSEPVLDPMCGSGTFVIEAAEIALGLKPGRNRSFAFEKLASFDPDAWFRLKSSSQPGNLDPDFLCYGGDRDAGAIRAAIANAARAGVSAITRFEQKPVSALSRPEGLPGLVMMNPPYGTRIGDKRKLRDLYAMTGEVLRKHFAGWRVGIITTDASLAQATGLQFLPQQQSVLHGGLRIRLFQTESLV